MRKSILFAAMALTALGMSAEGKGVWLETNHNFGAFDEDLGTVYLP